MTIEQELLEVMKDISFSLHILSIIASLFFGGALGAMIARARS